MKEKECNMLDAIMIDIWISGQCRVLLDISVYSNIYADMVTVGYGIIDFLLPGKRV